MKINLNFWGIILDSRASGRHVDTQSPKPFKITHQDTQKSCEEFLKKSIFKQMYLDIFTSIWFCHSQDIA